MIAQDAIVASIITLLKAAVPLAGVRIDNDVDFDAMRDTETRAVEVQLLASAARYPYAGNTARREWLTRLRISCAARADQLHATTGRKSSVLLSQVDAALSTDPTLAGKLTRELQLDDVRPDTTHGATSVGVMQAIYSCEHQTAWNQLTP